MPYLEHTFKFQYEKASVHSPSVHNSSDQPKILGKCYYFSMTSLSHVIFSNNEKKWGNTGAGMSEMKYPLEVNTSIKYISISCFFNRGDLKWLITCIGF